MAATRLRGEHMENKFYITFDKSQEDIPTLIVFADTGWAFGGTSLRVLNTITGDRAVQMWEELKGKYKEQNGHISSV